MKIKLTKKQQEALKLMQEGKNVFLGGVAGTGKSYIINTFIESLNKAKKKVVVCAPTGVAALNVHGTTMHRAFKVPLSPISPNEPLKPVKDYLIEADVIVIDEISMARFDVFDYCVRTLKEAEIKAYAKKHTSSKKNTTEGIIPKQVVVVGDFKQLPPVITDKDRAVLEAYWGGPDNVGGGFAFKSPRWKELNFTNIILDEVVRQDELEFVQALQDVRTNDFKGIQWIKAHCSGQELDNAIFLTGTNKVAKAKNEKMLASLPGETKIYQAIEDGTVTASDRPTDEELMLKVGARVMALINDAGGDYVNGSLGTITELQDDVITVDFDNGSKNIQIERNNWEIVEYTMDAKKKTFSKNAIGHFKQFPLKVAYAITIHKSQGQTYDSANISPFSFASGQLYVALSRVRDVKNIYFTTAVKPSYLIMDQEVLDFYASLEKDIKYKALNAKDDDAQKKKTELKLMVTDEERQAVLKFLEEYRKNIVK